MVLRGVVPSTSSRHELKRKAKDTVRAFAAQSAKFERRLQVVIADMIRSTWVDESGAKGMLTGPSYTDYQYAMSVVAGFGGTEACEAIYQEIKSMDQSVVDRSACLGYRLQALKVWMTERTEFSNFTLTRPGVPRPQEPQTTQSQPKRQQPPPVVHSPRWRADREDRDPASFAITVLRDVLKDIGDKRFGITDHRVYAELVVTLRQILRFLPESDTSSSSSSSVHVTLRKILQQALEKGFGIDFRFLRQDPTFADVHIPSSVLDSVMYLMGSKGEVWRMLAMFESLTGEAPAGSSTSAKTGAGMMDDEDVGETLSSALAAEAASRSNLDWLGRVRESADLNESGPSRAVERDLPRKSHSSLTTERAHIVAHMITQAATEPSLYAKRSFDDYLPSASSFSSPVDSTIANALSLGQSSSTGLEDDVESSRISTRLSPIRTGTITAMLDLVRKQGDIDLAVHLLRTTLREAASTRQAWLARVLAHDPDGDHNLSSTKWMTSRGLLVSRQWFESVHNLARTRPGAIWAADILRSLMDSETRAIRDEYRLLTGLEIDEPIDEILPTAPILRLATPPNRNPNAKVFDQVRHITQLKQTHGELVKLMATSEHQVERKRQLRALSNARRKERDTIAAQAEAERLELKKAGRRQKQEIREATLVMA